MSKRVAPVYSEADFEKVRVLDEQLAGLHTELKAIYGYVNPDLGEPTYYLAMSEYAFWATTDSLIGHEFGG